MTTGTRLSEKQHFFNDINFTADDDVFVGIDVHETNCHIAVGVNPLTKKAVHWPWSSLAIRTGKTDKPITLSDGPLQLPKQWHRMVNNLSAVDKIIAAKIERTINRSAPLGEDEWIVKTADRLGLESTIRPSGRPRKWK